jgi:hypothetical protein
VKCKNRKNPMANPSATAPTQREKLEFFQQKAQSSQKGGASVPASRFILQILFILSENFCVLCGFKSVGICVHLWLKFP